MVKLRRAAQLAEQGIKYKSTSESDTESVSKKHKKKRAASSSRGAGIKKVSKKRKSGAAKSPDDGAAKPSSRGTSFCQQEKLMVAESYMHNSLDAIKGTDKEGGTLWVKTAGHYNHLIIMYNEHHK